MARTVSKNPRSLTNEEISQRAGLPVSYVVNLSRQTSWDYVPVEHLIRFSKACGIDFGNHQVMTLHNHFYRRRGAGKWRFLRRSPEWETYYRPLIDLCQGNQSAYRNS